MSATQPASAPLLGAAGTPYECGRAYGLAAAPRIRRAVGAYESLVRARARLEWPAAVAYAARYDECIGDLAPRAREELRGIADGAALDYGTVLALNCRSELLFLAGSAAAECSSFGRVSDGEDVVGGQNWDWNPMLSGATTIRGFACGDEPPAVTVGEAGHLAKVGLNAAGLLVCTNTLVALTDGRAVGLPYHVVLRELLRLDSVGEALTYLGSIPKAMAANYLLVDRGGDVKDVEAVGGTGQEIVVLEADRGELCHTNHFLSAGFRELDARAASNAHTYSRLSALEEGLAGVPADPAAVFAVLRDHRGYPNALCSHPSDDDPPYDQRATLASLVANVSRATAWIAVGAPCTARYEAFVVTASGVRRAPDLDERTVPAGASALR